MDGATLKKFKQSIKVNIGWEKCKIYECFNVLRCYNCYGFNHKREECSLPKACSKCSGEHDFKDCQEEINKCINCVEAVKKYKIELDVNHSAIDECCPIFKKKLKTAIDNTTY